MKSKAQDPDIVATSTIMSLKCPLSTLRIDVPCRSLSCKHNQCFDASSYLQLQEQAPTWTCPVCNKIANFESLLIDQYVDCCCLGDGAHCVLDMWMTFFIQLPAMLSKSRSNQKDNGRITLYRAHQDHLTVQHPQLRTKTILSRSKTRACLC